MVRFPDAGLLPAERRRREPTPTPCPKVIQEMLLNRFSERQGRLIDFDEEGSMEDQEARGLFLGCDLSGLSLREHAMRTTRTS